MQAEASIQSQYTDNDKIMTQIMTRHWHKFAHFVSTRYLEIQTKIDGSLCTNLIV